MSGFGNPGWIPPPEGSLCNSHEIGAAFHGASIQPGNQRSENREDQLFVIGAKAGAELSSERSEEKSYPLTNRVI